VSILSRPLYNYETPKTVEMRAEIVSLTGTDYLMRKLVEAAAQSPHRIEWVIADAIKLLKKGETSDEVLNKFRKAWLK